MADSFSVSQQVIKSALNILEGKRLITRKSRKGIYVDSKIFSPMKKEIVCLTLETPNFITNYAEKFFTPLGYNIQQYINLTSKSIARENFNSLSFTYELKKLAESHLDCLVIQISEISRAQIKECLRLPFPVVFIGDFSCGDFSGLKYNQILENTAERAEMAMTTAIKKDKKKIAIIGGPLRASYAKTYYKKAQEIANQNDCKLYYAQHSDLDKSFERIKQCRKNCVEKIIKKFGKPDALILDGFKGIDYFTEAFKDNKISCPEELVVIADGEISSGCIFIRSDYTGFAHMTEKRIKEIMDNPDDCQKIVLSNLIERTALKISNL